MNEQQKQFLKSVGPLLGRSMVWVGIVLFGTTLVLIATTSMAAAPSMSKSLIPAGQGLYGTALGPTPIIPPSIGGIVGQVIAVFFGLLGIIFVALMVYGGFQWMTAAGNPEQVKKAQKLMIDAVIGVLILMAASFISYWVLYTISQNVITNV